MRDPINIAAFCLEESASKYPDHPALIHVDGKKREAWTYKEIWEIVQRVASGFHQMGLPSQSRILIRLPSSPDYVFALFAAMLGGFVPVPAYEGLTEEETLFLVNDSESALVIASEQFPAFCPKIDRSAFQKLKESPIVSLPKTRAEDPALLVYTSGTTSRPKGVLHAHRMVWGRRPIRESFLALSHSDVVLHTDTLNFTYTYGTLLMDPWPVGATALLYTGEKSPSIWLELIRAHRATLFISTPSTFAKILDACPNSSYDLPSLRCSIVCGDVMKSATLESWEKRTGSPLYEGFGMSEINIPISMGPNVPRKKGSLGKAQNPKWAAVLQREGEPVPVPPGTIGLLAIHRAEPRLMLRYWRRPEEERASYRGDWFLTGDLVYQDEDGYFFYIGRVGNILNIDADVVSPAEVEAVFENYPGLQEIGCWAVPGSDQAPILALFAVAKRGHVLSEEELLSHAKAHLADYKCPKRVFFVTKLPRDPRGKLLRRKFPELPDY